MSISMTNFQFVSQGATLKGNMYTPITCDSNCPAVIMAHGFSTTIKMTADKYAEAFCKAGFVVLLYDHRNLGESGGEPRQDVNYSVQARGYIDCLNYAESRPEINSKKIAVWGCSSSARLAYLVASIDTRPKVVIAQVPAFGTNSASEDNAHDHYNALKQVVLSEDISALDKTTTGPIAVASRDQSKLPSYLPHQTAADWFLTYGERPNSGWINNVTITRVDAIQQYHPFHSAEFLNAAILMVVAHDEEIQGANPEVVKEVFERIKQPKQWLDIHGGHFGLLHFPSDVFEQVCEAEVAFLNEYL